MLNIYLTANQAGENETLKISSSPEEEVGEKFGDQDKSDPKVLANILVTVEALSAFLTEKCETSAVELPEGEGDEAGPRYIQAKSVEELALGLQKMMEGRDSNDNYSVPGTPRLSRRSNRRNLARRSLANSLANSVASLSQAEQEEADSRAETLCQVE